MKNFSVFLFLVLLFLLVASTKAFGFLDVEGKGLLRSNSSLEMQELNHLLPYLVFDALSRCSCTVASLYHCFQENHRLSTTWNELFYIRWKLVTLPPCSDTFDSFEDI